mmetsp:Transcript_36205/g.79232  ORF Transcript_36205/g.79232 Transcript_36205/m.79232 type:complete len:506 (+) Transcript_36205:76-1593(+)
MKSLPGISKRRLGFCSLLLISPIHGFASPTVLVTGFLLPPPAPSTARTGSNYRPTCSHLRSRTCCLPAVNENGTINACNEGSSSTRRDALIKLIAGTSATAVAIQPSSSSALDSASIDDSKRTYTQQFPTLFDPLYGKSQRETTKREIDDNIWALEQSLILGPLETPLRCVVVKLADGTLWVHAPLAPTEEFFDLVESCAFASHAGDTGGTTASNASKVAHVVVPTYALEHKVFVKDALKRWTDAKLYTSPGQFSFPLRSAPDELVWGRPVDCVLQGSDDFTISTNDQQPSWTNEIQYETLAAGTFDIGGIPTTLYETAFFHKKSKTLIVTDSVAQISLEPPPLSHVENLLLVSKRSTSDALPEDTSETRRIGWEKTALLISYFFPEHEEPDPDKVGVVTWTEGWHDNFQQLAGRLCVPPVVRTLLYAQNPGEVRHWVDRVASRWEFERIVPAHWEAPITAGPTDFKRAFRFLEDDAIDAFPENDLKRGLRPIADVALKTLGRKG